MRLPFEELLKIMLGEIYAWRNVIVAIFVVISLSLLAVGTVWPKKYKSFSIILADNSNILQPLMEGSAEATRVDDYADNAREIIFGEYIMDKILEEAGWLENDPDEVEIERIKEEIKSRVSISNLGNNLIKIEYQDADSYRAYITVKNMAELFINRGEDSKIKESQAAYDFIEKQVQEYLEKLTKVEEELREFRSENPDSRAGLESDVSNRISRLQTNIEQTRMELREAMIRKDSIMEQLSGEAAITISQSREGQYRNKIAELQTKLETMRLDYKETYPDIVRLKHQIEDIKQAMQQEIRMREEAKSLAKVRGKQYIDDAILLNPLYQQLRSEASATETEIATLKARIAEMEKMLDKQYERAKKIQGNKAALAKLTRDYQVNQEIYQDLLRRRERARVSKSLDENNQGLVFKIQEPAKMSVLPTGVRFIHFMAAGLALGIAVPIGLLYIMIQADPRIRFSKIISDELGVPVLAEINRLVSYSEYQRNKRNLYLLGLVFVLVLGIYGYVGWLKYLGKI